jgi:hypothetical protein
MRDRRHFRHSPAIVNSMGYSVKDCVTSFGDGNGFFTAAGA